MIDPSKALRLIARYCIAPAKEVVGIDDALGRVLAEDIRSRTSLPSFDNSAMDGFTVCASDTHGATPGEPARLQIRDTVFAGDTARRTIRRGEAYRIMTGAPLPRGADTVIPKEVANVVGGELVVAEGIVPGKHVRYEGEELVRGTVVLKKGATIHAGTIGALATVGRARVRVCRRPRVSVIATGDETVDPGRALARGRIYDSNTHMLAAALRAAGVEPVRVRSVGDRKSALSAAARAALRASDVVVFTGGVSVGDRDYVREVLASLGVHEVFWRVRQKPGKPLYFGVKGRKIVFGLPGNPASVFTCFYVYVHTAIRRISGHADPLLRKQTFDLGSAVEQDGKRWRLLKARADLGRGTVAPLTRQGSHMVSSLVDTNSLIVVPPGSGRIEKGARVTTYLLPFPEVM